MKIITLEPGRGQHATFFRGAAPGQQTSGLGRSSYWTLKRKTAEDYAALRHGVVYAAEMHPRQVSIGTEPELAKYLGIYDRYIQLRVKDKMNEASDKVAATAKKAGIDARMDDNQFVVFNASIIKNLRKADATTTVRTPMMKRPKTHPATRPRSVHPARTTSRDIYSHGGTLSRKPRGRKISRRGVLR